MQGETLDDLKAVEQDLQEVQEKCRQIHLVADAEGKTTEERENELTATLEEARLKGGRAMMLAMVILFDFVVLNLRRSVQNLKSYPRRSELRITLSSPSKSGRRKRVRSLR